MTVCHRLQLSSSVVETSEKCSSEDPSMNPREETELLNSNVSPSPFCAYSRLYGMLEFRCRFLQILCITIMAKVPE